VKLAILHPGDMGVTVAVAMAASGHEVYWLPEGRSSATVARARGAAFQSCGSLAELVATVHGIVSVCPPHGAVGLARSVMSAGFAGTYVDANAVSPETAREIESILGAGFVDGGIIGPPALKQGNTRLYLSGEQSDAVAQWFSGGLLEAKVIPGPAGAASALKMCYAAYTKGSSAMLLAVRALAEAEGVAAALTDEWDISQQGLAHRSELAALGSATKAWRFVGEMQEIARTFRGVGLPGEFHDGAAEIFRRMDSLKEHEHVTFDDVLALLNSKTHTNSD